MPSEGLGLPPERGEAPVRTSGRREGPPVVLVVDADPKHRASLTATLHRDDAQVLATGSERAALETLQERDVAVAVIALASPGLDGPALARSIRGVDPQHRVPVIFVVPEARDRPQSLSDDVGPADFIATPVDSRALASKVDVLIALERQRRELAKALEETERARAETARLLEAERRSYLHLSRLQKVTALLNELQTPEGISRACLPAVCEAIGAQAALFHLVSTDGAHLEPVPGWHRVDAEVVPPRIPLDSASPAAAAVRKGAPVFLGSEAEYRENYAIVPASLGRYGARASLPMICGGRVIGTLGLSLEVWREFTEAERAFLSAVAGQAAQAFDRARLHEAERLARAEAQRAERRAAFLARAGAELAASLDYQATLEKVAALAVPALADWCAVDMVGEDRRLERLAVVHVDPAKVELARRIWREYPVDPDAEEGAPQTLRAGRPQLVPELTDAALEAMARSPEHLALLREVGLSSAIAVPILVGGQAIGLISFVSSDSRRRYQPADLQMAEQLAQRAATAIENARAHAALKLSDEKREATVAALERALRENELFAGVLAHDLRNPLTAILAAAQLLLLRSDAQGTRLEEPLRRILRSGERMSRMVDQLLDFTRARLGNGFELSPRETDLRALCAQVMGELEVAHPQWRLELTAGGALVGRWDPDRLSQLVSNLLGNAGQHGEPGKPIRLELDGTAASEVVLAVRNHGAIPAELLPEIFTPFRGSGERGTGGLGLGLYIAREIARSHRGRLEVESSPAAGTTFTLRLPR